VLFGFLLGGRAAEEEVLRGIVGHGSGLALQTVLAVVAGPTTAVGAAQNSGAVDRLARRRRGTALATRIAREAEGTESARSTASVITAVLAVAVGNAGLPALAIRIARVTISTRTESATAVGATATDKALWHALAQVLRVAEEPRAATATASSTTVLSTFFFGTRRLAGIASAAGRAGTTA